MRSFFRRHIEQVKKLMRCKDEASAECRKLMGKVTISVIMYDLIKKGLPLLIVVYFPFNKGYMLCRP